MDIKELVRTGMFSVGYLMCHTKKSRVVYYHDVHVGDSWTKMSTPFELFKLHISAIRNRGLRLSVILIIQKGRYKSLSTMDFVGCWIVWIGWFPREYILQYSSLFH